MQFVKEFEGLSRLFSGKLVVDSWLYICSNVTLLFGSYLLFYGNGLLLPS